MPKVIWYRNDAEVSNNSTVLPSAGTTHVRSELKVSGLSRKDVHSELTCQASNNPRTQPLAATLHVDMNCELFLDDYLLSRGGLLKHKAFFKKF